MQLFVIANVICKAKKAGTSRPVDGPSASGAGGAPPRWRLSVFPSSSGPYPWKMRVAQVDAAEARWARRAGAGTGQAYHGAGALLRCRRMVATEGLGGGGVPAGLGDRLAVISVAQRYDFIEYYRLCGEKFRGAWSQFTRLCHEKVLEMPRHAMDELVHLDLSILRLNPVTVHIPGRSAGRPVVFCWQVGDTSIGHGHELGEENDPRRPLKVTGH